MPRFGVPEACRLIEACSEQPSAIGTEAGEPYLVTVLELPCAPRTCGGVPNSGGKILTACRDAVSIGAEGGPHYAIAMHERRAEGPAFKRVPDLSRSSLAGFVGASADKPATIRAEFGVVDACLVA